MDARNQIIPINEDSTGKKTVNARDLHEFLGVGKDFSTWIKARIKKYDFLENKDFVKFKSIPQNGGSVIDYHLSLEMGKALAMVEANKKGNEARLYFIRCEDAGIKLLKAFQDSDPLVLQKIADVAKEKQSLEMQNKALELNLDGAKSHIKAIEPLADYGHSIISTSTVYTPTNVASHCN